MGWQFSRSRGDHFTYRKNGETFHLTIPDKRDLPEGTVRALVNVMGLSIDEFLVLARK